MPLPAGTRLGAYEIIEPIGAGGMGEVYRARDHRLNRDVALKIVPAILSNDPDRLARFEREAQVLASLNHPNIAAIFGIEGRGSSQALVLELVEGPTLADRLAAGRMAVSEALAIARQVADALAAAHDANIIHRDLKPANIKVRDDGTVKVLDFGLAKAIGPETSAASASAMNSPTLTARGTELGLIIGTAAYMAPEQARGKPVDRRADLWAFGVVLYEMLAGRRAFDGHDVTDVLAAVIKDTPSFDALPADVPVAVRRLLRRTLEKDRARRLDSMAAARLELDETDIAEPARADRVPPRRRPVVLLVLGAAIVSAVASGAVVYRAMRPQPPEIRRVAITSTADAPISIETNHNDVALTPDGRRLVYFSRIGTQNQLVVRSLDSFQPTILAKVGTDARGPAVSADGEWIIFQLGQAAGHSVLVKVPMTGGTPTPICDIDANLRGASWAPNGTVVFATVSRNAGLMRVPATGGTAEVLTKPATADGEVDHLWPQVLPDGQHVLFNILRSDNTWDTALLSLPSKTWKVLVKNAMSPRYASTGHIVFGVDGTLRAVHFDLAKQVVDGDPIEIVSGVTMKDSGAADFVLSATGTLAYLPGEPQSTSRTLAWLDSEGHQTPLAIAAADYGEIRISPDERFAVVVVGAQTNSELHLIDLTREVSSRMTPPEYRALNPVWSRDSRRVAFWSPGRTGTTEAGGIFEVSASGTSAPQRLTSATGVDRHSPGSYTKDGMGLLFASGEGLGTPAWDIKQVSLDATHTVTTILAGPDAELQPALSPDGRWLAYLHVEVLPRVFVRPFPNVNDARIPAIAEAAALPIWSVDGQKLYVRTAGGTEIRVVDVQASGNTLSFSKPVTVVNLRDDTLAPTSVGVPPVRGRVLEPMRTLQQSRANEYRIVLNWFEELKARVAAR